MNTNKLTYSIAILTLSLVACKKDKAALEIDIQAPAAHSEIHSGSSFIAKALFTDDKELAEYHVHLADVTGEHLHDVHDNEYTGKIGGVEYLFEQTVDLPNSLMHDEYYLFFELTDAEGKTSTKSVMLHKHH